MESEMLKLKIDEFKEECPEMVKNYYDAIENLKVLGKEAEILTQKIDWEKGKLIDMKRFFVYYYVNPELLGC